MSSLVEQLQQETGAVDAGTVASEDGSVVLLHHAYAASEGPMGAPDQLRLGLALSGGGRLSQHSDAAILQAQWRPGQFNLVLPGDRGVYASPPVQLLGLAINTARLPPGSVDVAALQVLGSRLHHDPVISAVLQAVWSSAQVDACLPGFLQHAAQVVLRRLAQLAGTPGRVRSRPPSLSVRQLQRLETFIDGQRGTPLDVATLAAALSMDASTFGRALQASTGLPPYAFLTQRRMHWAGRALQEGRSVTEVALASGYANPSKFAAAFRRVMGCAPSAWAAQSPHS